MLSWVKVSLAPVLCSQIRYQTFTEPFINFFYQVNSNLSLHSSPEMSCCGHCHKNCKLSIQWLLAHRQESMLGRSLFQKTIQKEMLHSYNTEQSLRQGTELTWCRGCHVHGWCTDGCLARCQDRSAATHLARRCFIPAWFPFARSWGWGLTNGVTTSICTRCLSPATAMARSI